LADLLTVEYKIFKEQNNNINLEDSKTKEFRIGSSLSRNGITSIGVGFRFVL
jgi:hypothetical protein